MAIHRGSQKENGGDSAGRRNDEALGGGVGTGRVKDYPAILTSGAGAWLAEIQGS